MAEGVVTFDVTSLPAPDGPGEATVAIVPEVVRPGQKHAPPGRPARPCPGCERGEQHQDEKGRLLPGHTMNAGGRPKGSKNEATKLAIEALRAAAPKAVRRIVRGIDSEQEWIAMNASGKVLDLVVAPEMRAVPEGAGPLIIMPPGTRMAILVPESQEARAIGLPAAPLPRDPDEESS